MAGSKYAYVKSFELPDPLLPNTFIVARLDGHGFHRFAETHGFAKPNDEHALRLMDHAAQNVMGEFRDIVLAFGESDEFSFLFRRSCALFNRRASKIITTLTSLFTSHYVMLWPQYFPSTPLAYAPSFDGRLVVYPGEREVRDYFAWRQADTHINNLYNTAFWALVLQGGLTTAQAHDALRGTVSSTKNDILFDRFKINYNHLPGRFRKGSVLVRSEITPGGSAENIPEPEVSAGEKLAALPISDDTSPTEQNTTKKNSTRIKQRFSVAVLHCDVIKDTFWDEHSYILA